MKKENLLQIARYVAPLAATVLLPACWHTNVHFEDNESSDGYASRHSGVPYKDGGTTVTTTETREFWFLSSVLGGPYSLGGLMDEVPFSSSWAGSGQRIERLAGVALLGDRVAGCPEGAGKRIASAVHTVFDSLQGRRSDGGRNKVSALAMNAVAPEVTKVAIALRSGHIDGIRKFQGEYGSVLVQKLIAEILRCEDRNRALQLAYQIEACRESATAGIAVQIDEILSGFNLDARIARQFGRVADEDKRPCPVQHGGKPYFQSQFTGSHLFDCDEIVSGNGPHRALKEFTAKTTKERLVKFMQKDQDARIKKV